jgi:hypothetical protein
MCPTFLCFVLWALFGVFSDTIGTANLLGTRMKSLKGVNDVAQLFVEYFIRIANLTKDSQVSFGKLFVSFMTASKILARMFVELGIITEEQLVKLNIELDEAVKTATYQDQVVSIIKAIREEEK